jgi:hypothetical protein
MLAACLDSLAAQIIPPHVTAQLAETVDAFVKSFVPEIVARCARQLSFIAGLMKRIGTESAIQGETRQRDKSREAL